MKHLTLPSLFTTLTLAASVTLTSCALDPLEVPDSEKYTREFIKQFGTIDADHDWNLSQRVTVNLSSAMRSDVATVNVYNKMPGSHGCQIAACFTPDAQTFDFDFPSSATMAWVDGRDAAGNVVFGDYYNIKDGFIAVGERASRAVTFPTGSYTCEDLSAYKAYEVKANKDNKLDGEGNPIKDENGNNVQVVTGYEWTLSDRSVFGNFKNTFSNCGLPDNVFAAKIESPEKLGLTSEEKSEIVIFSSTVNNVGYQVHGSSVHNAWPYHTGNDNRSVLVQEVKSEDEQRDFSKALPDGSILLDKGVKKYSWTQDGENHIGYFIDKGENNPFPLVFLYMVDPDKSPVLKLYQKYKNSQNLRMRLNVYYSLEEQPIPTYEECDEFDVETFDIYGKPTGTVKLKHRVTRIDQPSNRSWRLFWQWNDGYKNFINETVSTATADKTDDGYVSSVVLDKEQIDKLMGFERPALSGHGLIVNKVSVQLLDVDDAPAIPDKEIKPAGEAPLNEALKFYAIQNGGNYLEPNFDNESPGTSLRELMNLVGEHGVFNEGVNEQSHKCNMLRYADRLPSMKEGVTFEVGDDGEVALNFLYGATGFNDCFGYFYYKGDTPSDEELMKLPKYILIHNARPQRNLMAKYEGGEWHHRDYDMGLDEIVKKVDAAGGNESSVEVPRLRRSQYKLVNFGYGKTPDAVGTTKFEPGTKIGFFMILSGYTKFWGGKDNYQNVQDGTIQWMKSDELKVNPSDIAFSIPSMNKNIGHVFSQEHTHVVSDHKDPDNRGGYKYVPSGAEDDGFMAFARYSYGGYPLLSVEDWGVKGDHDVNDMIFYVSGVKTDDVKPVGTPVVQQSWLLMAEDLGGTHDLDFNDAVIGISHVATNIDADSQTGNNSAVSPHETTYGRIFLTGIAAGGTLPLEILYDGKPISDYDPKAKDFKYFHQWFGLDGPRVTNAMGFDKNLLRSFVLSGIPDFKIAPTDGATHSAGTALSKFSIVVWRDGERKELKQFWTGGAEGAGEMDLAAPQMIIIPNTSGGENSGCWKYPYECTPIHNAYPGFSEWVADKNKSIDWYHEAKRDQGVKVINHGWTGEPAGGM